MPHLVRNLLFLDTEFADPEGKELISLALVSEGGEHEFYAERDRLPRNATAFVHKYVYPLLNRGAAAMDDATFTARLRAFLCSLTAAHVIYDFSGRLAPAWLRDRRFQSPTQRYALPRSIA